MRELTYGVEGKAANLKTFAMDEPGHGGACHEYIVQGSAGPPALAVIVFQNGPINEGKGINGVQHEDLLAIIIDRLEGFEKGPYACDDNGMALDLLRMALRRLQARTRKRIARSVEGTHAV
jgi:hypothetical protein